MRIFKKYKSWSKVVSSGFFPLRVLKFKKTKWKKTKKNLLRIKNTNLFLDHTIKVLKTKSWDRIKSYYKNELRFNLSLKQRYDCKLPNQKQYLNQKLFFVQNYLKIEYRLDFLLYTLNFFSSLYEARQYIKNGCILINARVNVSECTLLQKGDVVSVLKKNAYLPLIIKKELKFSFLEIDYYTQTFVIIKSLNNISLQDIIYNFNEKNSV
jgi:ribosomal protein S4